MTQPQLTGVYGKLPAYGDFLHRNLPDGFLTPWDEWLQHYIGTSREQLGESWLDIYLTSPIWRFVISAGVLDNNPWAGIMLPSVDRVGRYFPFSIALRLSRQSNPLLFMDENKKWFGQMEELALQALDEQLDIDELMTELSEAEASQEEMYLLNTESGESKTFHIDMVLNEQGPGTVYPYLLGSLLEKNYASYSLWYTSGSELVAPCFHCTQGLPAIRRITAMLDGNWQGWGWNTPYFVQENILTEE